MAEASSGQSSLVPQTRGEAVEREIPLAHAIVGAMQLAIQREHYADRMLSHGVRRIARHSHNRDAKFRCRF